MHVSRDQCRRAREISEARKCANNSECPTAALPEDRDDFVGAVGQDALPYLLPHNEKLARALRHRGQSRRPVIDTPIITAVILACVVIGVTSGAALMAGWV